MKKRIIPIIGFVLAGLVFFLWTPATKRKPVLSGANILLITLDTVRPDYLSCYGSSNQTPNIDRIAKKGLLFENAFSQVPLTFPSHTSILTGLFPVHHSIHQNGLEIFTQHDALISSSLRKNGYKTGAVVSSFVLDRKFGLAAGFDLYEDRMERLPDISTNFEVERPANQSLEVAIRILDQWKNQKWFLWIHFYDPHTPYEPPEPKQGYAGEIQFVDEQIGKLMEWIERNQPAKSLIVAVMGDHGESLGEHGEKTHGFFVYNSSLKIPMIISYPDVSSNRISQPVATVDFTPTILELVGINDIQKRDGHSLLSDLPAARDIYFESRYPELLGWNGLQGVIRENWKLISTTRSELYDWKKDQSEVQNLFSSKQDVSIPLKNQLLQFVSAEKGLSSGPDAETIEKLKSLGYVGSTAIRKANRDADPKDKIALWSKYEESRESREKQPLLQFLVDQEPGNNFFRLSLAGYYRENGKQIAAIEQLKEAMKNDPSDSNTYHELAITYRQIKNHAEALRAAEAAITLEPSRTEYHSVRGMILVEIGHFAEARDEFLDVLRKDPNNGIAWNNLGNAYRELNQFEEALHAYQKSIELSPHYAYPQNGIGTVLIRQNRTQEAIPYLEKALKLDPNFVEVYLNLAIAFHTMHKFQQAKTLYLTFLKIAPDSMQQERANARLLLSRIP